MHEKLIERLQNKGFISLEITPQKSHTLSKICDKLDASDILKRIDAFIITDNPLAKLKHSSLLAAIKLQQKYNLPAIATITMRDRNKLALQSDILGVNEFDVRSFLTITGDSAKMSDQPQTKGVFESDSTMLLQIIRCFNSGIDYSGRELGERPKPIYPFAVSNSYAKNFATLQRKLVKKLSAGAVAIVTQPIYSLDGGEKMMEVFEAAKKESGNTDAQLIFGLFPITRLKTAQFLSAHVPGINVPDDFLELLLEASKDSEEEEQNVGFEYSLATAKSLYKLNPRIHVMSANKFDLADALIDGLKS